MGYPISNYLIGSAKVEHKSISIDASELNRFEPCFDGLSIKLLSDRSENVTPYNVFENHTGHRTQLSFVQQAYRKIWQLTLPVEVARKNRYPPAVFHSVFLSAVENK